MRPILAISLLVACKGDKDDPIEEIAPAVEDDRCAIGLSDPELVAAIETALSTGIGGDPDRIPAAHGVVFGIASPELGMQIQAFGFADVDDTVAMNEDAVFDIGSIQKNFRWTLLHHLAEQGLLDIDGEVNDVLANPTMEGVTFRQLAMHNSGLLHWDDTPDLMATAFGDLSHTFSYEEIMDFLTDGGTSRAEPGSGFWYSNYGPVIAGEAMATVMGTDIMSLTRSETIEALDLRNTSFQSYDGTPEKLAEGFWADDTEHTWTDDAGDARALSSAAGGLLFSNACDLLHYSQAVFHDEDYITTATAADMLASEIPWVTPEGDGVGTIYSGFQSFLPGIVGHLGSSQHGHSSTVMHRTADGTSFVVLANVASDTVPEWYDVDSGQIIVLPGDEFTTQVALMIAASEF